MKPRFKHGDRVHLMITPETSRILNEVTKTLPRAIMSQKNATVVTLAIEILAGTSTLKALK